MGTILSRVGLYWKSSNADCETTFLVDFKDEIGSASTIRGNKITEDTYLYSQIGINKNIAILNGKITCGSGGVLFSDKTGFDIKDLTFCLITEDNGRLILNYRETFSIFGLTDQYKTANGIYYLTTYFKNGKPTYTKKDNQWKIWWDDVAEKWNLTFTLSNSYNDSVNPPLIGNAQLAHKCIWSEQDQSGISSHTYENFSISGLTGRYGSANGLYDIQSQFILNRPTYKHRKENWLIKWADDETWKLAKYEKHDFSSSFQNELYNESNDVTKGYWLTDDDKKQRGFGTNSESFPTPTPTSTPSPTKTPNKSVKQIAVGSNYSLILRDTGSVEVVGDNIYGNLATGDTKTTDDIRLARINNVKKVATGLGHTLFLKNTGELLSSGRNNYGQLGDGTTQSRSTPIKIANNVKDISCKGYSSFYIDNSGKVNGFGLNKSGELGSGNFDNQTKPLNLSERPEEFNDILRYEPSNNKQQNADTLVLDSAKNTYKKVQPLTLKEDSERGSVFDFQNNSQYFDIGDVHDNVFSTGTFSISYWVYLRSDRSTEYSKRAGMIASKWYSSDRSWSNNSFIIYSTGSFVSGKGNQVSRIIEPGGASYKAPINKWTHYVWSLDKGKISVFENGKKMNMLNDNIVHEFSAVTKYSLSLGILRHNRKYSLNGKLDDFRIFDHPTNESQATALYKNVGSNSDVSSLPKMKEIKSGELQTFMLTEENELWGFGKNDKGQLGDGTSKDVLIPKKLTDMKVKSMAIGTRHAIIVDENDDVFGTGDNKFGQLGLATRQSVNKFTKLNKNGPKGIAAGSQHSLIVDKDGQLLVAGRNNDGQLGIGSLDAQNTFYRSKMKDITDVFAGSNTSYYVLANNDLLGSGDNVRFQMADGTNLDRPDPVYVGVKVPPTPTETVTPTATITFEEYDETQKCEITMTYLYRATKSSYKTNIIKFEVDVSDKPQAQTRQLVTTQINKGKNAEAKDIKISTKGSVPIDIEIKSTELKYSDKWYRLYVDYEIPPINVNCEFEHTQSMGNPEIIQKVVPNDNVKRNTFFGQSAAINKNFAVIGAPNDNINNISDTGSIYILKNE
jgi:alpha-tubulin suppressor-like RCC1 family protein